MSNEQYSNWPSYLRLIEHTWNTSIHTNTGFTPFEAAHGLPAATAVSSIADEGDYCAPNTMDQRGMTAISTTAKAINEILQMQLRRDTALRADQANQKGINHSFEEGDTVAFYIPPTAHEAEELGRKVKHIQHFKGPARVVKKLSPTTFAITYEGTTYGRCLSELRPYRSEEMPLLITAAQVHSHFKVGNFVALCDTDDPNDKDYKIYHVGKIVNLADGQAQIQNYATQSKNIANAVWSPLYQLTSGVFTVAKPRRNALKLQVVDTVDEHDDDYVRATDLRLTSTNKLTARSRKLLARLELKHHVLGLTYP